ncbi:uncharacterized protein LOC113347962 [Papaver somniferum]|nr:uncharacterized protein LOC113347962 [Papaver somniferum]XP_026447437.1 uncharacterized protein LOC113347962 [Papaver somniferum]XP_026447438.1 uncharacterized protein LOC113347962 [Papaver somniferum]
MLHRGFKGGKCKTSLKLAVARIKLLKNKREVNLRQMKRDLAKLLETGQEQTARIRVEHVVREEKTMSAYDLIEIYCELVVARLPIIESQKTCPVDLKEAVTSIVFAAPRCADIPELVDIRKHFTAKYGKEFITSALELRPDSGVSRQVVEKLSAKAPDGETKIKILTAIAKEHNVNWDRKDFEDKELKPPEDLLNGPNVYDTTSVQQSQPTPVQKYDSSRSSTSSQDYASTNATSSMPRNTSSSTQFTASERPNGGRHYRDSSYEKQTVLPTDKQHWNMEFKDANEAAHAAAESAERASRAARAAAEIASGRNIRQYSPESRESFDYSVKDERWGTMAGPNVKQDPVRMTNESRTSSSKNVDPRMQDQQRERNDSSNQRGVPGSRYHSYDGNERSSDDDRRSVGNPQRADRKSHRNTSEVEPINSIQEGRKKEKGHYRDEVRIQDQFTDDSEVESVDQQHNDKKTEYTDFPLGRQIRVQSSKSVSPSCASIEGDEAHSDSEMHHYGSDLGGHSFHSTLNENARKETRKPSFKDNSGVVFDEYDFEEDRNLGFKDVCNSHESESYAPKPIRESPPHASQIIDSWTPRKSKSGSAEENFGVKSDSDKESHSSLGLLEMLSKGAGPLKSDDSSSVAFDDYPESEEETDNYEHSVKTSTTKTESTETNIGHGIVRSSFKKKNEEASQKPSTGSSHDPNSQRRSFKRNQETEVSYVGEPENSYSVRGSIPSSFIKREAARANVKPELPSSSDDSESEGIYGSRDRQIGAGGEYSKRSGAGVSLNDEAFPSQTDSPRNRESENSYSGRGSKPSSFVKREAARTNSKVDLPSSSDDSESEGIYGRRDQQLGSGGEYSKRSGGGASLGVKAFPSQTNSPRNRNQELRSEDKQRPRTSRVSPPREKQAEDTVVASCPDGLEYPSYSSSESGQGLNLGRLPGGLRNKVSTRRTRPEIPLDNASPRLTQQTGEDTPKFKSSPRTKARDPELLNQQAQKAHRESSSRSSKTCFDSDSDDSDLPKRQTVRRSDYKRGGLTYKPRHTPSESDASNLAMFVGGHDLPETSHISEREKASYGSGSIATPQMENSGRKTRVNSAGKESGKPDEEQSYGPVLQPKGSSSKGSSKSRLQNTSPSVEKQPPEPIPEAETVRSNNSETLAKNASSESPETKNPSSLSEGSTSRENSLKKASHVHPKLPDFDAFTAHFQSLRSNVRPSTK